MSITCEECRDLFADAAAQSALAGESSEELIEFGLHAHAQIAKHEGGQGSLGWRVKAVGHSRWREWS